MGNYVRRGRLRLGAATVVTTSLLSASGPLLAQDAPGEAEVANVVVTGTRIRQPNVESSSPIAVVSDDEFRYQGQTSVENVLNRLPQFTPDANENVSNGSDGTAKANLRSLGSNRVLTLINGQRMLPTMGIDLNFIPGALVERVEVLTGGASAVYGADAVSGVINFILRDDLDGMLIDTQYSTYQHENDNAALRSLVASRGFDTAPSSATDGAKRDITLAAGTDFAEGKGNVMFYGTYHEADPVLQSDRDYSACALNPAENNSVFSCGGSSQMHYGGFIPLTGPNNGTFFVNTKDGQKTWDVYNDSYAYNFAPDNYIQRVDERYTAGAFMRYDANEHAELYGSFMFMDDHSFSQVAPSAIWLGRPFTINCDNPFMSSAQAVALCGADAGTPTDAEAFVTYRMEGEGALPRRDDLRHTDYRFAAGVRGDITPNFSYDVGWTRSNIVFDESYKNDVDQDKAANALQVVLVDGVPTCKSVVDGTDPECLPLDVFAFGSINPEAFSYVFVPTFTHTTQSLTTLSGNVTGDLTAFGLQSPWASQGVGFAVGVESREETLGYQVDAILRSRNIEDVDAKIETEEAYGELSLPVLSERPFAESVVVKVGYRYSRYDNVDEMNDVASDYDAETYKLEADWAPTEDFRFRASFNRAIRAPDINELFAAQLVGNVAGQDPCAGPNPSAPLEVCQQTGMTPEQYGNVVPCPADVCTALGGGNPALKPEEAETYTYGLVLTPSFLPDFVMSIDYFRIQVDDYINSIDATTIISQCIESANPFFCGLFNRDPQTGTIFGENGYVVSTTLNTGFLRTSGVDIVGSYERDLADLGLGANGSLAFELIGTYTEQRVTEPVPDLGTYDCVGLFGPGCGQPSPRWRHNMRVTWHMPWRDAALSLNWRHFGGAKLTNNKSNPFLAGPRYTLNDEIAAYNYLDLATTLQINEGMSFRAGVNNVLDKSPPAIASGLLVEFGNGNTYPGVYDPLGRMFFAGLRAQF
jgi:iron complex outermembrane receptor protein